jgi:hypothetical protein
VAGSSPTAPYSFDVAHDTQQGTAGGTKTESIPYDKSKGKLTGGSPWARGQKVQQFR